MQKIGTYVLIFGIGSIILSFLNMNFRILMWIDLWGPTIGWVIRIGFVVIGAILMFMGGSEETSAQG